MAASHLEMPAGLVPGTEEKPERPDLSNDPRANEFLDRLNQCEVSEQLYDAAVRELAWYLGVIDRQGQEFDPETAASVVIAEAKRAGDKPAAQRVFNEFYRR